jgi:hypothetical protein
MTSIATQATRRYKGSLSTGRGPEWEHYIHAHHPQPARSTMKTLDLAGTWLVANADEGDPSSDDPDEWDDEVEQESEEEEEEEEEEEVEKKQKGARLREKRKRKRPDDEHTKQVEKKQTKAHAATTKQTQDAYMLEKMEALENKLKEAQEEVAATKAAQKKAEEDREKEQRTVPETKDKSRKKNKMIKHKQKKSKKKQKKNSESDSSSSSDSAADGNSDSDSNRRAKRRKRHKKRDSQRVDELIKYQLQTNTEERQCRIAAEKFKQQKKLYILMLEKGHSADSLPVDAMFGSGRGPPNMPAQPALNTNNDDTMKQLK